MKRLIFVIALLALAVPASVKAQELDHAPTVEQCKADANLWKSQWEIYDKTPESERVGTIVYDLTIPQIEARFTEMGECYEVDQPYNDRSLTYLTVNANYFHLHTDRFNNYILRHHLRADVLREDREGLR